MADSIQLLSRTIDVACTQFLAQTHSPSLRPSLGESLPPQREWASSPSRETNWQTKMHRVNLNVWRKPSLCKPVPDAPPFQVLGRVNYGWNLQGDNSDWFIISFICFPPLTLCPPSHMVLLWPLSGKALPMVGPF